MAAESRLATASAPSPQPLPAPEPEVDYDVVKEFAVLRRETLRRCRVAASSSEADAFVSAFLAAAGLNQMIEDYLHRDVLRRAGARLGGGAATHTLRASATLGRWRAATRDRRLVHWQRQLQGLVDELASAIAAPEPVATRTILEAERILEPAWLFPAALRRSVVRVPVCFSAFDQRPEDCRTLAVAFADRWPERDRPIAVIGIRTSGSYLAPLCAAHLRSQGFQAVEVLTWRRGQRWLPEEGRRLATVLSADGLALLVDDPPISGGTLQAATQGLERIGFPTDAIVLLLQTFDSPAWWPWPSRLARFPRVVLPWDRWTIQERLRPGAVQADLTRLLAGRIVNLTAQVGGVTRIRVASVERVEAAGLPTDLDGVAPRGRVRARFRVWLRDGISGRLYEHHAYVKGTGLADFGQQSLAVAQRLGGFVPETYGAVDGLLYRAWLPAARSLPASRLREPETVSMIAEYVAARAQALPVATDHTRKMVDRDAVWQRTSDLFGRAFGRAAPLARPILHRAARRLLTTSRPSLIDGSMRPTEWFTTPAAGHAPALQKVHVDEGAFSSGTPISYDAIFDLAAAAVGGRGDEEGQVAEALRAAYVARTGRPIDDTHWFLSRLLVLHSRRMLRFYEQRLFQTFRRSKWADAGLDPALGVTTRDIDALRAGLIEALGDWDGEMSSLLAGFVGDQLLGDVRPVESGPLCAIDIDGVLETYTLTFASTTPAALLALRALARHGHRAVLATGRSLAELRDRCRAYRLTGGVAEYGACLYNHTTGAVQSLLSAEQAESLQRVRRHLSERDDIHVDPSYRHGIRAWTVIDGVRRGLDPELVAEALERTDTGGRVCPVIGRGQTDFTAGGCDKGTGLRALARELGVREEPILSLAIGDTESDGPMLALAARSFAPVQADAGLYDLARAGRLAITHRPAPAALLEAVSALLSHRPGTCPRCRPPRLAGPARLLTTMLAAQDSSGWGKGLRALDLALQTVGGDSTHA